MIIYSVCGVYYARDGINGAEVQHQKFRKHMQPEDVARIASNWEQVKARRDPREINNITIDLDAGWIIQAGGYSKKDGLFCDLY